MAQCPDIADGRLDRLGAGWDNESWRLGDDLLVRLPRRQVAVPLILKEQRWLPQLAPSLPLPVPVPVRAGRPSSPFGWPWSVVPWFPGAPADVHPVTRPVDAALSLGTFLRALHQPAPEDAPHNPWRGVPLADRGPTVAQHLDRLPDLPVAVLRRRWEDALAAGRPPCAAWVHADLHPGNLVVRGGTLAAVLDFGDLTAGDPATDLAAAWMLLPTAVHDVFWSAYGGPDTGPDDRLRQRAAGWAVLFALVLLDIGLDDRPTYAAVARTTVARLVEGQPG